MKLIKGLYDKESHRKYWEAKANEEFKKNGRTEKFEDINGVLMIIYAEMQGYIETLGLINEKEYTMADFFNGNIKK